jgi:NAD(P)-dependent dehydrogenase (short-subunit alcohol dehydrogenase family)
MADVQAESLAAAARDLSGRSAGVLAVRTDVSEPAAVDALAAETLRVFGRVDLVCNNAGVVSPLAPAWQQDPAAWRWLIVVKLLGVVHGIRSFVPHLIERGRGHVLNTASVGGLIPLPMLAPYNAVMHAVIGLTETIDAELHTVAPGVGATVLCPGRVATSLAETSAQNRPPDLNVPMPPPQPPQAPQPQAGAEARARGQVLTAVEVARLALDGVEQGRLHVITHPDSGPAVRARAESVLVDLPPSDHRASTSVGMPPDQSVDVRREQ